MNTPIIRYKPDALPTQSDFDAVVANGGDPHDLITPEINMAAGRGVIPLRVWARLYGYAARAQRPELSQEQVEGFERAILTNPFLRTYESYERSYLNRAPQSTNRAPEKSPVTLLCVKRRPRRVTSDRGRRAPRPTPSAKASASSQSGDDPPDPPGPPVGRTFLTLPEVREQVGRRRSGVK